MKVIRILVASCLMCFATSVLAQREQGSLSIIPKIGPNISSLTTDDNLKSLSTIGSEFKDTKVRLGLTYGVDIDYQAGRRTAISFGAQFSKQGTKFVNTGAESIFNSIDDVEVGVVDEIKLKYLQIPVMLKVRLLLGLYVEGGIQPSIKVGDETVGELWAKGKKAALNMDADFSKFDLSIPVGVAYELGHFVFDARYCVGLTNVSKEDNVKMRNSNLSLTIGYRLTF